MHLLPCSPPQRPLHCRAPASPEALRKNVMHLLLCSPSTVLLTLQSYPSAEALEKASCLYCPVAQSQPPLTLHSCFSAEALEKASEERAGLIASRAGEVLGAHTILKEDHFPGCQSAKLPNTIPGAPNFRGVPGQNVYGSALPTVDGIKEVLDHVGAAPKSTGERKVSYLPLQQPANALLLCCNTEPWPPCASVLGFVIQVLSWASLRLHPPSCSAQPLCSTHTPFQTAPSFELPSLPHSPCSPCPQH